MNASKAKLLRGVAVRDSGCWEWTGATRDGYGAIRIDGRIVSTHRLSFSLYHGPIPDDLLVCHKCDNRRCVRPSHLFCGTHKENNDDCRRKGRQNINPVAIAASLRKIGDEHADVIALLVRKRSTREIGTLFGVCRTCVQRFMKRLGIPNPRSPVEQHPAGA